MEDLTAPNQAPESADRRSADIGIICSHIGEVRPFLKKLDRVRKYVDGEVVFRGGFIGEVIRVALVEAGNGFAKHRHATETLISEHNPPWIISTGYSSALIAGLKQGDVCLANNICDEHGNSLEVACKVPEAKRVHVRKYVVADQHPDSVDRKRELSESYSAAATDTSSLAVGQVCNERSTKERRIRFMAIRVVIDEADECPNPEALGHLFDRGATTGSGVVSGLLGRIRKDPNLTPWKKRSSEASENLSRFILSFVHQVAEKLGRNVF